MPDLPTPPSLPARDHGWIAQALPMVASMGAIGALSLATGHRLVALLMMSAMGLGLVLQLDLARQRRHRAINVARHEYADQLAQLTPSPDWELSSTCQPREADPVCIEMARRRGALLALEAAAPERGRTHAVRWRATVHPAASADLRVRLGGDIVLDLAEAAAGGDGPHGMVVGATGSGKSELLAALILELALVNRPTDCSFVLVDFKGGTGLSDLAILPHCAGFVSNLADEVGGLERMVRALGAEIERREIALRAGATSAALNPLVIVIDEFSELLVAHPEVVDVLARVGRLGRSLRLHLVLSSQRLDEHRVRDLEAHLSWRIALRTFTENESRVALGSSDAAFLPREPGWALIRTGPDAPARVRVLPAGTQWRRACVASIEQSASAERTESARPVWLPAITVSPDLAALLAKESTPPVQASSEWPSAVPLGVTDDPVSRETLHLDLGAGHVAIVGRPATGKSSLLDVIAAGLEAARVSVHRLSGRCLNVDALAKIDHLISTPATNSVIVIDDWSVLRQEHPHVEEALGQAMLGSTSLRFVIAAHRWADVRVGLRDLITTKIEFRLGDPFDSLIDRHLSAALPLNRPGWGLIDGHPFVAAQVTTNGNKST